MAGYGRFLPFQDNPGTKSPTLERWMACFARAGIRTKNIEQEWTLQPAPPPTAPPHAQEYVTDPLNTI